MLLEDGLPSPRVPFATEGLRTSVSTVTAFCAVASKQIKRRRASASRLLMQDRHSLCPAPRRHHQELSANGRPRGPFRRGTAPRARTSAVFSLVRGPRPPAHCSRRRGGAPRGRRPYFFTGPRARADGATARLFTARLRWYSAAATACRLVPSLSTAAFAGGSGSCAASFDADRKVWSERYAASIPSVWRCRSGFV